MVDGLFFRVLGFALITFCAGFGANAAAAGTVESLKGDVRIANAGKTPIAAALSARVGAGTTVTTRRGAQAVIRFDDGTIVVLDQNTEMQVIDSRFNADNPKSGIAVFNFITGAMRVVTGQIAEADPTNFAVRTTKASLSARSADFSIASGSLYLSVSRGAVTASNTGGSVIFNRGEYGFVDTVWTRPVPVASAQLPTDVVASFTRFGSVSLAGGGAATGAGAARGATEGGGGSGAAVAAVVAGLAAAASGGGGGGGSTPTTTHH